MSKADGGFQRGLDELNGRCLSPHRANPATEQAQRPPHSEWKRYQELGRGGNGAIMRRKRHHQALFHSNSGRAGGLLSAAAVVARTRSRRRYAPAAARRQVTLGGTRAFAPSTCTRNGGMMSSRSSKIEKRSIRPRSAGPQLMAIDANYARSAFQGDDLIASTLTRDQFIPASSSLDRTQLAAGIVKMQDEAVAELVTAHKDRSSASATSQCSHLWRSSSWIRGQKFDLRGPRRRQRQRRGL